jgi:hypothetical protein
MSHPAVAVPLDEVARVVGYGSAEFEEAQARLDALRVIGHPGLWLPERVELEAGGNVVAHGSRATGFDLASLVRLRGKLGVGECVAVGVDVAGALAALHDSGLVHGDLSPANAIVTPTRVVLVDLIGGARRRESGTPGYSAPERSVFATAASDVYSLGRLLSSLASDDARERVDAWTAPLTAPTPASRPPATEVAIALRRCATPVPVSVPDRGVAAAVRARALSPDEVTVKTREGRPWRLRRVVTRSARVAGFVGVGLGVIWGVTTLVGAWVAAPASVDPSTLPIPAEGIPTSPGDAASTLTLARFEAIADGDAEGLLATTVEGSEARLADDTLAAGLEAGEIRFEGLGVEVVDATVVEEEGNTATVRVAYVVTPHETWEGSLHDTMGEERASAELGIVWTRESGWRVETARALP